MTRVGLYWPFIRTIHKQPNKNTFSFHLEGRTSGASVLHHPGHDGTTRWANLSLCSVITFYILRYRLSSAGPDGSVTATRLNQEANRFFKKMVMLSFFISPFSGASWSQISIKVKCCYICCWQRRWLYSMNVHLRPRSSSIFRQQAKHCC